MLFLTESVDNQQIDNLVNNNATNLERIFNFDWGLNEQLQTFLNKCIEVVTVFIVLLILCKIVDLVTKSIKKL